MGRKEGRKNAYMTVEASLIMPLVLLGIVFILFLGFYLYNVCILRQVAYTAALRGSLLTEGSNAEIEEYTEEQLMELVGNRLIAVEDMEYQVEVSLTKVKVKIFLQTYSPLTDLFFEKASLWKFEDEAVAKRLDMVSFIRGIRMVGE
ncbi:MAG: pilus assembly protein [Lachnospiraceae bacterium]|nr:pilus assembly protein [Lachnospiraceae bacterium]